MLLYFSLSEIVSELAPFCKQRFLLSAISSWSCNVRTAVINSVSASLTESCGFGSHGLWNGWRSALLLVKPETVIAWHRQGFHLYWRWKSRRCKGRPTVAPEVRNLIRKMSLANPRWGAPRIR